MEEGNLENKDLSIITVFVFNHKNLGDLEQLLTKEYHIPSTAETENRYIDFNVVELMNSSGNTDISFNHENL